MMEPVKLNKRKHRKLIKEFDEISQKERGMNGLLNNLVWQQGNIEAQKYEWWKKIRKKFPEFVGHTVSYNTETREVAVVQKKRDDDDNPASANT